MENVRGCGWFDLFNDLLLIHAKINYSLIQVVVYKGSTNLRPLRVSTQLLDEKINFLFGIDAGVLQGTLSSLGQLYITPHQKLPNSGKLVQKLEHFVIRRI